jgi:hypothetical protein
MTFVKDGVISVWVGEFSSKRDLDSYVEWTYDEDGEGQCAFARYSGLGWFDHDFQEANYLAHHPTDYVAALSGHSYQESFRDPVGAALVAAGDRAWNSLFLLYGCAYDPNKAHPSKSCRLRFVGCFPYQRSPPGGTDVRVRVFA